MRKMKEKWERENESWIQSHTWESGSCVTHSFFSPSFLDYSLIITCNIFLSIRVLLFFHYLYYLPVSLFNLFTLYFLFHSTHWLSLLLSSFSPSPSLHSLTYWQEQFKSSRNFIWFKRRKTGLPILFKTRATWMTVWVILLVLWYLQSSPHFVVHSLSVPSLALPHRPKESLICRSPSSSERESSFRPINRQEPVNSSGRDKRDKSGFERKWHFFTSCFFFLKSLSERLAFLSHFSFSFSSIFLFLPHRKRESLDKKVWRRKGVREQ